MENKMYKMENDYGLIVEFMALGGRINTIKIPSDIGVYNIVVGYNSAEEAAKGDEYLGALCGRVANRIDKGKFELEGKSYQLAQNNGPNALHGGPNGFHKKIWNVEKTEKEGACCAYKLSLTSEDGDENYPGELKVEMIYSLNNKHEFEIDIKAVSNKTTIVNLTSHPYFNLNGVGNGPDILNHRLVVNAKEFTPIDENSIPTGEIRSVEGTDMDLREGVMVEDLLNSSYEQIKQVGGIDHNWVIDKAPGEMGFAMGLYCNTTQMSVEMFTTQPAVQLYAGMHFDGSESVHGSAKLHAHGGMAVEAQNFPDAINHSNFPSPILKAGETYHQRIMYKVKYVNEHVLKR